MMREPLNADKVLAEASCMTSYHSPLVLIKWINRLITALEQSQRRVAELESAASSLLERAEKPLNLDEILLQQALAPNQCTKCGKQMTAEKIKADGGIHTCMQKG